MQRDINTNEIKKQIEDNQFRRYVLSVTAGQESLVIENLQERVNKQGLNEDVVDFLSPMVSEASMKKGEKVVRQKKLYPGYVFFKSKMNDKIWYVVRNTPGVRLIVGAETKPIPLTDAEYQQMMSQIAQAQERAELVVPFQVDELVRIKDGEFKNLTGKIKDLNPEESIAVVNVEVLGRLTPVTIAMDKIELVN
ncbi:transcription termination/antitermination protein NusG [Candidatus Gracilibacteria bacterium]|jgi:transcription termination/antitermination factor NusG|nr:transcription termination/antitermination protein NusG [candidate division SR1 bacterium]MBF0981039.1 transcription termination/antitermination protein NusG [Candidatus Gracilibacteria bacterium]